ncbi:MAG TPA: hypothetical protein VJ852_06590 [Gemmatimonadaceae bacterium]|nr:hypothetical protein [Gemmatimonadaceae bacterium]
MNRVSTLAGLVCATALGIACTAKSDNTTQDTMAMTSDTTMSASTSASATTPSTTGAAGTTAASTTTTGAVAAAQPNHSIDLNTATDAQILSIPGVGQRMLHEFKEYRPYTSMDQFRREIGKYVDKAEVARLEQYVTIKQ